MKLDRVQISQFRNIEEVSLNLNNHLNVFLGENGSGKSSILEAIHYLGFSRSFRTSRHKNVIKHGCGGFTVFCSVTEDERQRKFGISRQTDDTCIVSIDGTKSRKATDLASKLPIQIFTPQSSDLLLGAPKVRRRYVDWLLFHVEQSFNVNFQVFNRSLRQLNALYKKKQKVHQEFDYWAKTFSTNGEIVTKFREDIINKELIDLISSNLRDFLPEFSFEISYYRGWEKGISLAESLLKNRDKDQKNGFIGLGPHKADLRLKVKGVAAHEVLSRGQLRMLVAAMQLAQTEHLNKHTEKSSIFLLDDIGAELDEEKRKVFINRLSTSNTQLFVTAIDINQVAFLDNYKNKIVFHVEHGQVREEI